MKKLTPVISLLLICMATTLALSLVNSITKERIRLQALEEQKKSLITVMPGCEDFITETFVDTKGEETSYFRCEDGEGNLIGYVFVAEAKGYNYLAVMTGVNTEGLVTGIEIIECEETPGLGMKCRDKEFKDKFKVDEPVDSFTVVKDGSSSPSEIDALTAATKTTDGVVAAVNEALELYRELVTTS